MENVIYPKQGQTDKWKKALIECEQKGFLSAEERDLCFELEGIPKDLLERIHLKMDLLGVQFKGN